MHITQFIFKEQAIVFLSCRNSCKCCKRYTWTHCTTLQWISWCSWADIEDAYGPYYIHCSSCISLWLSHSYSFVFFWCSDARTGFSGSEWDILCSRQLSCRSFYPHSLTHSRRRPKLLNSLLHGRLQKPAGSCWAFLTWLSLTALERMMERESGRGKESSEALAQNSLLFMLHKKRKEKKSTWIICHYRILSNETYSTSVFLCKNTKIIM